MSANSRPEQVLEEQLKFEEKERQNLVDFVVAGDVGGRSAANPRKGIRGRFAENRAAVAHGKEFSRQV